MNNVHVLLPFSLLFYLCFVCVYQVPSSHDGQKSRRTLCFPTAQAPGERNATDGMTAQGSIRSPLQASAAKKTDLDQPSWRCDKWTLADWSSEVGKTDDSKHQEEPLWRPCARREGAGRWTKETRRIAVQVTERKVSWGETRDQIMKPFGLCKTKEKPTKYF